MCYGRFYWIWIFDSQEAGYKPPLDCLRQLRKVLRPILSLMLRCHMDLWTLLRIWFLILRPLVVNHPQIVWGSIASLRDLSLDQNVLILFWGNSHQGHRCRSLVLMTLWKWAVEQEGLWLITETNQDFRSNFKLISIILNLI